MGLSSSQARLLSLTGRMHDIEYKAQRLEAQKLQMANESAHVYQEYENALNATKIQLKQINADGTDTYIDATYNILMNNGYRLSPVGFLGVTQEDVDFFNNTADKNAMEFACLKSGYAIKVGNYVALSSDTTQYLAFDAAGLKKIAAAGKNIILMDDIDVTSSLGTLSSTLNGNGHTLNVSGKTSAFSSIQGGSVQNLNINANITGSVNVGALASTCGGNVNIENISVNGSITTSSGQAAGLIAETKNGNISISNINLNINVSSKNSNAGGIVGQNSANLNIGNVSGNVSAVGTNAGGIIGNTWSDGETKVQVENCNISTTINSTSGVAGGIIGMAWDSVQVNNCYVTGKISSVCNSGYASAGGILGGWGANSSKADGQATVSNCYTDVVLSADSQTKNPVTADITGLKWNTVGKEYITNCASSNGTAAKPLYNYNPNIVFTEAANTNSVKSSVLAANSNSGAKLENTYNPETFAGYQEYYHIGQAIATGNYFILGENADDSIWLKNMLDDGFIMLQKADKFGEYYDVNIATDTSLKEVSSDIALKKAEAKYEADMRKINNKDKKFDTDLAALEQERNAINTEMDTLKTVAKDNVDRTFKLFS